MTAIAKWLPGMVVAVGDIIEPRNKRITMYKCTASIAPGKTGLVEPSWTDTITGTHTDGDITWECIAANYIEWSPRFIYKSNNTEPTWPTTPGGTVVDAFPTFGGEVTWTCRSPIISDEHCPQHEIAFPMSQKVFSPGNADEDEDDVVRYCATNAPKDWTTPNDAGFIPTGQHSPKSVAVTAMNEYRGRMPIWTASDLQIWDTDPDPAEIRLFDSISGIGTIYPNGAAGVAGDLFFTTSQGVRTLSVAAGATNLQAGDVGTGVDELVIASLATASLPIAFYYPSKGQFWVAFPGASTTDVYVYSMPEVGKRGSWSRYVFPWVLEAYAQLDNDLYLRAGVNVYKVDETAYRDETADGVFAGFEGIVQWPYLDLGSPGTTKMLVSCDISGISPAALSVAYDPENPGTATTPYVIGADTTYGTRVPIALAAPALSFKLTWPTSRTTAWQLNSFDVMVKDMRMGV
jgi:hypothetical protein